MKKLLPEILTTIGTGIVVIGFAIGINAAQDLGEVSRLKRELFNLKVQLTQCTINVNSLKASQDLTEEQKLLTKEFSKELGCTYNWQLGKCDEIKIPTTITTSTNTISK